MEREYLDYAGKTKTVKIFGSDYEAFFPEKHTNVRAVMLDCRDLNAGDSYANITRYELKIFVLRKGERQWENVYCGLQRDYGGKLNADGIFPLLFSLEDESFKAIWRRKREISNLRATIKTSKKKLEKLLKEK